MKKIITSWFTTPLGLAREILWINDKDKIVKRKTERKPRRK